MQLPPETRTSLIANLQTATNQDAWHDFVEIYEPFIYRQALRSGLQAADASEVVQCVLVAVNEAIGGFQPDSNRARFRTWLYAVGRNICLQHLGKLSRNREEAIRQTDERAEPVVCDSLQLDLRRRVFNWATGRVKEEFTERTWSAFWKSTVESAAVVDVARELGMSQGAVYIARSRVMSRIKREVQQVDARELSTTEAGALNRLETDCQDIETLSATRVGTQK